MMKKRVVSAALAACMLLSAVPFCAYGAENEKEIHVVIENQTYAVENGSPWAGILVDEWVTADEGNSVSDIITSAAQAKGHSIDIQESQWGSYLNGADGLTSGAAGGWSGWMIAYNDCFENTGLNISSLSDGDELLIAYSLDGGADLGYHWDATDTSLAQLKINDAEITPEFSSEVTEYVLNVPDDKDEIFLTFSASDKRFACDLTKNGNSCVKSRAVSVSDGDMIRINVHGSSDDIVPTEYVFNVTKNNSQSEKPKEDNSSDEPKKEENDYIDSSEIIEEITSRILGEKALASAGNEWYIMTLARQGKLSDELAKQYEQEINNVIEKDGLTKATDYARVILALSSLRIDASDYSGRNLIAPLADHDFVSKQGINGSVYTLIALCSRNYRIPVSDSTNQTTTEALIDEILASQLSDGGWTFFGDSYDPDMTAMALQALSFYSENEKVKPAIERALSLLSEVQNSDGSYTSYGSANADSTAQVLMALSCLGIDCEKDERFIKDGNTIIKALGKYYISGSAAFSHTADGEANEYTTVQAYYALCAHEMLVKDGGSFFAMGNIKEKEVTDKDNTGEKIDSSKDIDNSKENSRTSETNKPSEATGNTGIPGTGDNTGLLIMLLMAAISAGAVIAGYTAYRKTVK